MSKLPMFEDFIPVGFGTHGRSSYSLGANTYANTGYNMDAIVGPIMEVGHCIVKEAYTYESDDNPNHTAESYIKEAKKHINSKIDEIYEGYNPITETSDYEYDPKEHADRLKRREEQNIQRYRAAQDRGDNYAIALYELKIKLDKIDFEKLKVLAAIDDLKEKFDKK